MAKDDIERAIDLLDEHYEEMDTARKLGYYTGSMDYDNAIKTAWSALRKIRQMEPLLEHLFQTFAGGWYGGELHDAITSVWRGWEDEAD